MIERNWLATILKQPGPLPWSGLLLALTLSTSMLGAQEKSGSIAEQTRIHRLTSDRRTPYDAFVYVNRIPEAAEEGESPGDFAGRIFGRLANQEGRILLKLPPGMDREAYLGYKTFLGSEGDPQVTNCVTCHTPADFTDSKVHVVAAGGASMATPSLRNLKERKVDLRAVILAKMAASQRKRSGQADDIHDDYARMTITEADVDNLVAFLNSLNDVADSEFRNLIIKARVLDTTQGIERSSPLAPTAAVAGVAGVVLFEGPRPTRLPLPLTPESRKLYRDVPLDENVLISEEGEVANVFVTVKSGLGKKAYPPPQESVLMNQEKSMFRPRVQGVQVGQTFLTRNSDPFIHNVRSLSLKNRAFNMAQPARTADREKIFRRPEGPIRIQCDFHPWMKAFVFVMEHPFFAVSDEKGRFRIEGLPPGECTLEAWHEEFGKQRVTIKVGSGPTDIGSAFTFKARAQ